MSEEIEFEVVESGEGPEEVDQVQYGMAEIQAEIRAMFINFHNGHKFDFKRLEEIAKYGKKNL
jgi:hypothetical protein